MDDMNKENCVMIDRYNRIQGAVIKRQNRNYSIYKGVNTIGRNKTATVNLKNLNVSQNHAVIIIVDDTQHFISDLNSSNGTYLHSTKLSPYKLYELINDVEIKFGDVIASYFKVPNGDATLHLEKETCDNTQSTTQNFYGANTQLMINESSLNNTNSTSHRLVDLESINEAETEVVCRPPENSDTNTYYSDTTFDNDIHECPTQAVDYQLATTSATIRGETKTPSDISLENEKLDRQQEADIHAVPTQIVDLPQGPNKLGEQQDMRLHEMATQVIDRPQALAAHKLSEDINDSSTRVNGDTEPENFNQCIKKINSDTKSNETLAPIENMPNISAIEETIVEETLMQEHHSEKDVNEDTNDSIDFLTIQKPFGNVQTFNKGENLGNNATSTLSDSQDVGIPRKRPPRKLSSSQDLSQTQYSGKAICNPDSDTDIEDEIGKINHSNLSAKKLFDSGSDTDIEDHPEPDRFKKKSKVLNSDSETDLEEHISHKGSSSQSEDIIKPKILNKKRALDSDSETDIEDNREEELALKHAQNVNNSDAEILNDTDCIPATQDAFADVFEYKHSKGSTPNVNSQNASSEESFKLGLTELMVESVENKVEDNIHEEDEVNNGLNEENIEKVNGDHVEKLKDKEDKSIDLNESDINQEHIVNVVNSDHVEQLKGKEDISIDLNETDINEENIAKVVNSDHLEQLKDKEDTSIELNETDKKDPASRIMDKEADEDLYLKPTQKVFTDVLDDEPSKLDDHDETTHSKNSTMSGIANTADISNDDIYIMPTQKLNEKQIDNRQGFTPSTSKVVDKEKEANEDFYLMPTQNLNRNDSEPQFKTPQKRFNFRKKGVKLDASLSSIFSRDQQDPYSVPTQKLCEDEDKNEDFYLLPTQKLNKEQKQNDLLAQDLNLANKNEEDLYMAPTQQINVQSEEKIEEIDEDLYMAATQPIKSISASEKMNKIPLTKVSALYLQETEDLGFNKNIDASKNENNQSKTVQQMSSNVKEKNRGLQDSYLQKNQDASVTAAVTLKVTEKNDEDPYLAATQPINSNSVNREVGKDSLNKPIIDLYLQETEYIGLNDLETKTNDYTEDITLTKQIKENLAERDHGVIKDNSKISIPPVAASNENSSGSKRQVQTDLNISIPKKMRKIAEPETETLSQIDAFIKQPMPTLKKPDKCVQGASKRIPKEKTEKEADQSETLSQIQRFVTETSDSSKKSKVKALPKKRNLRNNANNEIVTAPQTSQSGAKVRLSKLQETHKIKAQSDEVSHKPESDTHVSKEECEVFNKSKVTTSQSGAKVRLSKLQETGKVSDKIKEQSDEVSHKPESDSHVSKGECEDFNKSKITSQSGTSVRLSKLQETDKIKAQSDEASHKPESDTHLSKAECEVFNKSKATTSRTRTNVRLSKLKETDKVSDNIMEQFDAVFHKPESNTHVSKEECGVSEQVEKSFALLEAKSTKTRKSRRLTGSNEVTVALGKNRRSMAISAVPKTPKTITESKPATRKSRKKSTNINNNDMATISESSGNKTIGTAKRKLEPTKSEPSSEIFESGKPNKMPKTNASVKAKRNEDSHVTAEFSTPSTSKVKAGSSTRSKKSSSIFDEDSNSNDSASSTRGRRNAQSTSVFTPSEKGKRKQKPKVVFTMLDSPLLESLIKQMGGSVVDSVEYSTVLVTEHVKRSQKLLTAVGQGKPICSPEWIRASKKANEFLDPWDYILLDKEAESKWNFSLRESISSAKNEKLLGDYTFQIMVTNATDVLKGAIEACGGKCAPRYQEKNAGFFVIIASPEHRNKYLRIKKQHPQITVVQPEAIFDGVLRQDLRLGNHLLT